MKEIMIPSISAITGMLIVLFLQRKLEREVNGFRQLFIFHVFNVLVMMMFYGTTSLALKVIYKTISKHQVEDSNLFFDVLVLPFPFILTTYIISAFFFRMIIRPYFVRKGTNVVYIKKGIRPNNRRRY